MFSRNMRFAAGLQDIGNELPDACIVLEEFGAYRPELADSQGNCLYGFLEWWIKKGE